MNPRLCSSSSRLHTSSSYQVLIVTLVYIMDSGLKTIWPCWVLIWVSKQSSPAEWSRQSSPVESLSGAQDSPSLSSSQSFQNRSRRVHTSGPVVLGNLQRPVPSSLAFWCQIFIIYDNEADVCTRKEVWLRPANRSLLITKWRLRMIQPHVSTNGQSADTQAEYPSGLYIDAKSSA